MSTKDLIEIPDFSIEEIKEVFDITFDLKRNISLEKQKRILAGKSLGMIFHKPSTRTRVSFEVGIWQLGGQPLYLGPNDLQLNRGETISDTAKVLSRYLKGIMIRTFSHQDVVELGKFATIPVINGLTNFNHPCQILGDIYTAYEEVFTKNEPIDMDKLKKIKVAFIGSGNNVCTSWLLGAAYLGLDISVASPNGFEPNADVVQRAEDIASESGSVIFITTDPKEAAQDADVIYTDVWVSMGEEEEAAERYKRLKPYQVNTNLVSFAKKDFKFMHCLPAHRGQEVTNEIIDSKNSAVLNEAENRLHLQKGIMVKLMADKPFSEIKKVL